MAQANLDYSDTHHVGQHRFDSIVLPAECFGDTQANPNDPFARDKTTQQVNKTFAQAHGTAAADERRVVHVARGAGTVIGFQAGPVVAAVGDSTVTADLRKNGTTVLTAVVTIDSGDAAYAKVTGTVVSTGAEDYAAGDVFEVVLDATVGTGTLPQGVFAEAVFEEAAA